MRAINASELPWQRAIRSKCFHPSGVFTEFRREEIEQSISDRFEQQVNKYPDRLAIRAETCELTYDELNNASNRVARALIALRGTSDEPVPLLMEKGPPLISAILGVLKAGKFYVPLDPQYPRQRLAYMLEDSQAGFFITDTQNLHLATSLAKDGLQQLNVDELDASLSTDNVRLSIPPDAYANIFYTSGSTGQPKGVLQNQRNVLHQISNHTNNRHICEYDRLTLLSSCSYTATVKDIFGALLNGAALFPFDLRTGGVSHLANWLAQEEITIYRSVPSVFCHFASVLTAEDKFPKLRLIHLGGEPFYNKDLEKYRDCFSPTCIFVNSMGCTEMGPARDYFIDKQTQTTDSVVPAGYAVEGVEVQLLDPGGQQVGFDSAGEIAFRSRYLSPGYWRRPELTKAAFLPDPEGGDERVYRTGDLGRILPDGCLTHLGRKDFQVKIRGHRVELAEIELALLDIDNVKEAGVLAEEQQSGDKRLVAYLAPEKKPAPTVGTLRRTLAEKLPDHMIPAAYVILDTLPLTLNGKLDRQALSEPGRTRPELEYSFVSPRTPVEEALAEIWSEVLGLDEVGIHDNFFDVGGNSLLAANIISRVITNFRVELPLQFLFEAPTVAAMSVVITQNKAKTAKQEGVERMLAELEAMSDEEAHESSLMTVRRRFKKK